MSEILKGTQFTLDDVSLGKPKVNASGGKNIPIFNAKAKKLLNLSTPLMLTWGVNENDFEGNGRKTYDMALQFPSEEYNNESSAAFLKNMTAFENHIKSQALENCKDWFNKTKMSADVIDALWTPILKYPKDKDTGDFDYNRPPTLRIKIPIWEGVFKSEIYDMEKNMLFPNADNESLTPGDFIVRTSNLAAVITCGGIWFANGKFGVTWKLLQAMVKPKQSLKGKCHIDLDVDEKSKLSKQVVDEVDDEEPVATTDVADSDDEQETPVENTPPPPPEPAPEKKKKKVVKKKKAEDA